MVRAHMTDDLTDVRAEELADALREAHYKILGGSTDVRVDPGEVLADALLALPNIATVALPEPAISQDTYQSWIVSLDGEQEYVTAPAADDEVAISGIGRFIPSEARALAAALLAAANAAEQAAK